MTAVLDTLSVIRSERTALIRDEVRTARQREQLERAAREAVTKLGLTVDEVSEASGLTPAEIHALLDTPAPLDDLSTLAGVG